MPRNNAVTMDAPAYVPHWAGKYRMTPGVAKMAKDCGANWLVDRIALTTAETKKLAEQELVVWKFAVQDRRGVLTATDGDYGVLFTEPVRLTDFPLASVTIWVTDGVLLLPDEY